MSGLYGKDESLYMEPPKDIPPLGNRCCHHCLEVTGVTQQSSEAGCGFAFLAFLVVGIFMFTLMEIGTLKERVAVLEGTAHVNPPQAAEHAGGK